MISFHSICQSPRKLWATSDQAEALVSRWRSVKCSPAAWCWWPVSASWALRRAVSSSRGETKNRKRSAISAIITSPPTYWAR